MCPKGWSPVCVLALLLICIPPSTAFSPGYEVVPWDGAAAGETVVPAPVSWWEVSPALLSLFFLFTFVPVGAASIALFFALRILVSLGFRRVGRRDALEHEVRAVIAAKIRARPGICFSGLMRALDVNRGTLRYHLSILEREGMITVSREGRSAAYFENSGKYSAFERQVICGLGGDAERRICSLILAVPETTRNDIAGELGISGSTVSWHIRRLSECGIIEVRRRGRSVHYALSPGALPYVRASVASLPAPD